MKKGKKVISPTGYIGEIGKVRRNSCDIFWNDGTEERKVNMDYVKDMRKEYKHRYDRVQYSYY